MKAADAMMTISTSVLKRSSLLLALATLYSLNAGWLTALTLSLACLSYLLLCAASWPRSSGKLSGSAMRYPAGAANQSHALVVYASQSGNAEQLARKTCEHLLQAGLSCDCLSLDQLTLALLLNSRRIFFVVSTTGEGDPPDNGERFSRLIMSQQADLSQLEYAILALGDRRYPHFCAFAHRLEHWLRQQHASSLFDLTEVDNSDAAALRHWQYFLSSVSGHTELLDWERPAYQPWKLAERSLLNPDSQGGAVYRLRLLPPDSNYDWQAGDIAEIGPYSDGLSQAAGLAHREYSIASLPIDGALELVVRQHRMPDGQLGSGSGWLTEHAQIGQTLALRIRANPTFRIGLVPALILIGNGTGLAGLRAHLRQRIDDGEKKNWLLFGERQQQRDFFFAEEMLGLHQSGWLELDLCFSRDQPERRYVQHALAEQAQKLREWVAAGATILVCGSLHGMAGEVHERLQEILGSELLEQLGDSGRYRRDVY